MLTATNKLQKEEQKNKSGIEPATSRTKDCLQISYEERSRFER